MADVFSKKKRSEIMSNIRNKDTGIEKIVFAYLRKNNIYFQKHYSKIPGKPDIALPSQKKAVFINGDFWHGYRFGDWKDRLPKDYWKNKIAGNIKRDAKNYRLLRKKGWRILKIWSHRLKKSPVAECQKIANFLKK